MKRRDFLKRGTLAAGLVSAPNLLIPLANGDIETRDAPPASDRALAGARLKDCYMVDTELRQLIEQGYFAATLRASHDPWAFPMPDAQGGVPTIIMEMLLYSRPGVIEVLPALPPGLRQGSIKGMLARTFARIDKLAWNMDARTVELAVT